MFRLSSGQHDLLAKGYTLQVCVPIVEGSHPLELLDVPGGMVVRYRYHQHVLVAVAGAGRGDPHIPTQFYGAIIRPDQELDPARPPALSVAVDVLDIYDIRHHRRDERRKRYQWPGQWRLGAETFAADYGRACRDNHLPWC